MIEISRGVQVVERDEWGARAPRTASHISGVFGSTCHWEGGGIGWPWSHATCYSLVRGIQNFHMDGRGWSDIAYSSMACPHGYVFQGRWLGVRTAANGTNDGNSQAFAHCYLGGQGDPFTADGQRAMRAVLDYFDAQGAGPGRNGHRDWKPTACPGDDIYLWVHTGQPADGAPEPPAPPPILEDDDMAYLMWHPTNGAGYLVTTTDAVVLDGDTFASYETAKFKVVRPTAATADQILDSARATGLRMESLVEGQDAIRTKLDA